MTVTARIVGRREAMFTSLLAFAAKILLASSEPSPSFPRTRESRVAGNLDARLRGHDDDDWSAEACLESKLPATGVPAQSVRHTKETRYLADTGFLCADGFAMMSDEG
jgi:hypothetical protein